MDPEPRFHLIADRLGEHRISISSLGLWINRRANCVMVLLDVKRPANSSSRVGPKYLNILAH